MSEIEKLYELANIKKQKFEGIASGDYPIAIGYEDYPPFSEKKQLELIKWLCISRPIHITFLCNEWIIEGMIRYSKRYNTFENALCGYIITLWQYLTETEQDEIRKILKG